MKAPYRLRRATAKDMPHIRALITRYPDQLVQDRLPACRNFLVVTSRGKIVGCAALEPLVELRSVAVAPSLRKQGIGKMLVNANLDRAQKSGYNTVVLGTDSAGYFVRFGFEVKTGSRTAMFLDLANGRRKAP